MVVIILLEESRIDRSCHYLIWLFQVEPHIDVLKTLVVVDVLHLLQEFIQLRVSIRIIRQHSLDFHKHARASLVLTLAVRVAVAEVDRSFPIPDFERHVRHISTFTVTH